MKSRAQIKSHPLHPILIAFPIAFLVAALLADLASRLFNAPTLAATAAYASIAAIVSGLLAAIPGLIDYLAIIPPDSSARKRATYHMLVNAASLLLIAAGTPFRDWNNFSPSWLTVLLELAAISLMSIGGWLGGTLVYRNQIGVDHRYAHAGKWTEITLTGSPGQSIPIPDTDDLQPGQMRLLHYHNHRIVLARTDNGLTAFPDRCPHRGGPLSDGALICQTVQCPWHGSQFDAHTGQLKAGPAKDPIPTYPIEIRDGKPHITLPT